MTALNEQGIQFPAASDIREEQGILK